MSLEYPIFGSREGREEVLSNVPKNSETPPVQPESVPLYQGQVDVEVNRSGNDMNEPVSPKNPIGFRPAERSTVSESPAPTEQKHDLRIEPEPQESEKIKTPPVAPITETPVFSDLEKPKPKQTFSELKSESIEDYGALVDSIKEEIQTIKDKAGTVAKLAVEKTGVAPVYRGSKTALEKFTKTAFMVRSINQYGWWRLGKEATVDTVKRKAEELTRKGLKYLLDNLAKREDVLNAVSGQLEKQTEPLRQQLTELIAIKKALEAQAKN
ncbi:MAG: hypothetical protein A2735_02660 [Candidatus Yanofskybacteria bacterium RIFCSPHIGHO2_01_FULL_41_21]|uniref:Uncharacterized protein n=1 Tax=Candidatus Yanofskybacteria bacterium RIFCSPHIGHO2_01_FULL_41_21 TaxID=1802660 RepID=A0A1F8EAY6_9BACT|nr:MAG: hypothetical protein A2735_02660 [Candidatus Yanofskybacteria bacterium RIFCSPHIGHO2_01_FULL_41_21]